MSVVINMSKVRKALDRAKKQAEADANAVKFGRTAAEKAADQTAEQRAKSFLDGHKRGQE